MGVRRNPGIGMGALGWGEWVVSEREAVRNREVAFSMQRGQHIKRGFRGEGGHGK